MGESIQVPSPQKWRDAAFLDQMRNTGDPLPDQLVVSVYGSVGTDAPLMTRLLEFLIHLDGVRPAEFQADPELKAKISDYVAQSGKLPGWHDPDLIKRGEELFRQYGMIAFSLLGCASLPELYTCGNGGTQVLDFTTLLENRNKIDRRLVETAQMVVHCMSRGGLQVGGPGVQAVQKVRLLHAAMRFLLLQDPPVLRSPSRGARPIPEPVDLSDDYTRLLIEKEWQPEWGVPIGQEFMAGTLLTFSYVILRGLKQFGISLDQEIENAYIHTWNVVGALMGVREDLLVWNYSDAEEMFDLIMGRTVSTDAEQAKPGIKLTTALLDFTQDQIQQSSVLSRFVYVRHVPKILIREFIGVERAELLGVTLDWKDRLATIPLDWLMRLLGRTQQRVYASEMPFVHRLSEWLFRKMAVGMWGMTRHGSGRAAFDIPEDLARDWNLARV